MQDLAEEIGLAAGGIYHYFESKEQLLAAIVDELMEPLLGQASNVIASGMPSVVQLRELVHLWVAHVVEHRDHMLVFGQERHVIERGEQWESIRDKRKGFQRLMEAALERVEQSGEAEFSDRRLALAALLGMVNHTAQWYRPRGRYSPGDVADGYLALLLSDGPRPAAA
jgi:AcrR family transcriptional regulator